MHFQGNAPTSTNVAPSRFVLAGTTRRYERPRPFQLLHQSLDVLLLLEKSGIEANATLTFRRVDKQAKVLPLDAIGFEIDAIRLIVGDEERTATFDYDGNVIAISIPLDVHEGKVQIEYSVVPRRGLYFLKPDEATPTRPNQVWSQCQDEDARFWFPCHDAPHMKLTSELCVTVPAQWVALSNGTCLSKEISEEDATATYHFFLDRPHPSYLVTLVAGEFSVLEDRPAVVDSSRNVAIRYYVPVGREADGWRTLGDTPKMVELFSQVTGLPYPFGEYSQVIVSDFIFGGMENTTATTLYEHALLDPRAAIDVDIRALVAHELAHQWFGDTLTCRDWSEAWLNEGFATFFEHVERDARLGRDEYDWGILADLDGYLSEFKSSYDRPIVCKDYQAPIDLFDRHLYEKGCLVLHMLRRKLGSEVFWPAIREYVKAHENGVVETNLLKRVCEQVSGKSLDRFFDNWIYRSGHPDITVEASYDKGRLVVTMKQDPKGESPVPFELPFEIQVMTKGGELLTRRIDVTTSSASITLDLDERPSYIAFDPELCIAAPVKLELGFDWLKNLILSTATLRARVLAAKALSTRFDVPTSDLLASVLIDAKRSYLLRIECARALGKIPTDEARTALLAAVGSERAEVRRAVANALGQFRQASVVPALTELALSDRSYLVQAEACRALGQTRQIECFNVLKQCLEASSWADVVRAAAIDAIASLRVPEHLPLLREQTRYGLPTRSRRAAIAALGRVATDRVTLDHLGQLLRDTDPHVRADTVDALVAMEQPQALPLLSAHLAQEADPRVQRHLREALRDLGGKEPEASKQLADEMTSLKSKLSELEARLAKLISPNHEPEEPETKPADKARSTKRKGRAKPATGQTRNTERKVATSAGPSKAQTAAKKRTAQALARSRKHTAKPSRRATKPRVR